eukprot:GHVU01218981.1.p1 GENE.GHVU01218981.1~~GHVU01218981.1.p1  ORF type:complete len:626 (+),score=56.48 GHVU01218981.1:554-2431(+)
MLRPILGYVRTWTLWKRGNMTMMMALVVLVSAVFAAPTVQATEGGRGGGGKQTRGEIQAIVVAPCETWRVPPESAYRSRALAFKLGSNRSPLGSSSQLSNHCSRSTSIMSALTSTAIAGGSRPRSFSVCGNMMDECGFDNAAVRADYRAALSASSGMKGEHRRRTASARWWPLTRSLGSSRGRHAVPISATVSHTTAAHAPAAMMTHVLLLAVVPTATPIRLLRPSRFLVLPSSVWLRHALLLGACGVAVNCVRAAVEAAARVLDLRGRRKAAADREDIWRRLGLTTPALRSSSSSTLPAGDSGGAVTSEEHRMPARGAGLPVGHSNGDETRTPSSASLWRPHALSHLWGAGMPTNDAAVDSAGRRGGLPALLRRATLSAYFSLITAKLLVLHLTDSACSDELTFDAATVPPCCVSDRRVGKGVKGDDARRPAALASVLPTLRAAGEDALGSFALPPPLRDPSEPGCSGRGTGTGALRSGGSSGSGPRGVVGGPPSSSCSSDCAVLAGVSLREPANSNSSLLQEGDNRDNHDVGERRVMLLPNANRAEAATASTLPLPVPGVVEPRDRVVATKLGAYREAMQLPMGVAAEAAACGVGGLLRVYVERAAETLFHDDVGPTLGWLVC